MQCNALIQVILISFLKLGNESIHGSPVCLQDDFPDEAINLLTFPILAFNQVKLIGRKHGKHLRVFWL